MYVNQVLVASQMAREGALAWKQHRCWPFVETTSGPRMRGPQFLLKSFAWCGSFGIGQPRLPGCRPEGQAWCTRKRVEYNVSRIVDPHGWEHNRSSGKKVEVACLVLRSRFGRYCTERGV